MGEDDLLWGRVGGAGTACWLLGIAVVYFRCLDGFQFEYFRYEADGTLRCTLCRTGEYVSADGDFMILANGNSAILTKNDRPPWIWQPVVFCRAVDVS